MRIRVFSDEPSFLGLEDFFLHDDLMYVEENLTNEQTLEMLWNSILCRISYAVEIGTFTLDDIDQHSSKRGRQLIRDLAKLHDAE